MNTCDNCGKQIVKQGQYCMRCINPTVRAFDNTERKCFQCNEPLVNFYARYPISNPHSNNRVPVGFYGLCKECNKQWTFTPAGDLIARAKRN